MRVMIADKSELEEKGHNTTKYTIVLRSSHLSISITEFGKAIVGMLLHSFFIDQETLHRTSWRKMLPILSMNHSILTPYVSQFIYLHERQIQCV